MDDNTTLQFSDKTVTFEQFVDMLATKVALRIHQVEKGQLEISQAQAYKLFGRADVERWVRSGNLEPVRISPGKKRYRLIDLQKLASIQQNKKKILWHQTLIHLSEVLVNIGYFELNSCISHLFRE